MATNFPASLDALTNPVSTDTLANPSHSAQHANANDAIEALEAKVGADGSAVTSSHDYKISTAESNISSLQSSVSTLTTNSISKTTIDAKGDVLVGTADDTLDRLAVGADGYILTANSSTASGLEWVAPAGGGTGIAIAMAFVFG